MLKCFKHSSIQIDYCLYWSHVELMAVCLPMCHRHARSCVVPSHLYIVFVWWLAWEFLGFAYKIYVDITICVCVSLVELFRVWKLIFSLVCFLRRDFSLSSTVFVLFSKACSQKKKNNAGMSGCGIMIIVPYWEFFFAPSFIWRKAHAHIRSPPFNRWVNHTEKKVTKGPLKGWNHSRKTGGV